MSVVKRQKIEKIEKTGKFNPENLPPFTTIGLFVYLRTYARRHDETNVNSTVESWQECLTRCVLACGTQLGVPFTEHEQQEFFSFLYNLQISVAGRFLWQLGTRTVTKIGNMSLMNCAFIIIDNPAAFLAVKTNLMLGVGQGYSIRYEHVNKLPMVKFANALRRDQNDSDFIVPDSREGWVKLFEQVLRAHFETGESFTYSCMLLRSHGAPIKGFGGTASGGEVLADGMRQIDAIFNRRAGQKLRPVDCLDILNLVAFIVVSGNTRRSAQLAIGDVSDLDFLTAKDWSKGTIPNSRCYSNNSVVCDDIQEVIDNETFWKGYLGQGEPYGLINLRLSRSCGRLGETQYTDPEVQGYNPCAEQSLANHETCCLSEVYLPNIKTKQDFFRGIEYLYRVNKHALRLPCKDSKETEKIVHQNMRMGIGITGVCQATEEQKGWLSDGYVHLRKYDKEYSRFHGFPESIKLTTCKPSGTLSLLGNCTSGIHAGFAQYYIRRVRISSESPLVKIARDHGYPIEFVKNFDGSQDMKTSIISFPTKLPEGTLLAENCSAVRQLENVKWMQTVWSDNAVSVTVYYRKHELPEIKEWLRKNYNNSIKSVSFLLHSDHGFAQAPLEAITKEQYEEMASKCSVIKDLRGVTYVDEDVTQFECAGGQCPVR